MVLAPFHGEGNSDWTDCLASPLWTRPSRCEGHFQLTRGGRGISPHAFSRALPGTLSTICPRGRARRSRPCAGNRQEQVRCIRAEETAAAKWGWGLLSPKAVSTRSCLLDSCAWRSSLFSDIEPFHIRRTALPGCSTADAEPPTEGALSVSSTVFPFFLGQRGGCHRAGDSSAGDRSVLAGPLSAFPNLLKREPWQGQSQDFSEWFQATMPPRWGHIAEHSCNCPASSQ